MSRRDIIEAGRVVAALDLVTAFGHVSARTSPVSFDITGVGDLAELTEDHCVAVDLRTAAPPVEAPGEVWLHTAVYRARPDVGAVVRAQPIPAFAVASTTDHLTPLHGQAAWLGASVPVHAPARLLRSAQLGAAAAATLGTSYAMLLRGNGAVAVGSDPASAATRMYLLTVACEVWLRAHTAGDPETLSVEDAAAWAAAGEDLLPRLWRHLLHRTSTGRVTATDPGSTPPAYRTVRHGDRE